MFRLTASFRLRLLPPFHHLRSYIPAISLQERNMAASVWTPPATIEELHASSSSSGLFTAINFSASGARSQRDLPKGSKNFQLYSISSPNGQKVSILLEELGIPYDAHLINIVKGEQFTSGFVELNANSKVPAALDLDGPGGKPIRLFESASIMLYLSEKHGGKFIPKDAAQRVEMMNWIFWQMGGIGPIVGQFGHFMMFAAADLVEARNYGVARYGMEVQRLCDVLDKHLEGKQYIMGDEYTLADMASFPWLLSVRRFFKHPASGVTAADFLSFHKYKNLNKWLDVILARPAVERGLLVCAMSVPKELQ
eukprot:TRINITY_DN4272_c0_g2_i1.p1 TRINITY_DN4272_c0_g2~~TRINITY_DN4272_c0_g2_i1.p1  ORF type:complete len:310 (-),score=31.50 TRINITY_DN4272_c0_g2_i1:797-1726(-)